VKLRCGKKLGKEKGGGEEKVAKLTVVGGVIDSRNFEGTATSQVQKSLTRMRERVAGVIGYSGSADGRYGTSNERTSRAFAAGS
jgi:hypothetical protein